MYTVVIFLVALAVYLPFNAQIPITDPVESNYALTAKEMLAIGDWLSPRIYGQFWYDKPAMIYWLIISGYKLFGVGEFAARFPAGVFSAASVSFMYWFGYKIFDSRRTGLLAALVLGTSLEFWVLARMVITDAILFFYSSVALGTLYLGLDGRGRGWYTVAYFFTALAVLTKGPVGIVLPVLIVFVYIMVTRRFSLLKRLFILPGILIFLATAAPWYIAMYQAHGKDFLDTFLGLHNYIRATVSEHPKDNVFYYYLELFPISLLPWTGVFFRSLYGKRPPHFAFLAVWLAVTIAFYTMMATKYPTYVFPATFPAALLIAYQLEQMRYAGWRQWLWLSVPALTLVVLIAAAKKFLPDADWTIIYPVSAGVALVIVWLQLRGDRTWLPWTAGIAVAMISILLIVNGAEPLAKNHSAKLAAQALPVKGAVVAAYGDYATSAVFYSGYVIPRLVQKEQDLTPSGVWAGKYTMPTETATAFAARTANNPEAYILVNNVSNLPVGGFRPVGQYGTLTLYKRDIMQ